MRANRLQRTQIHRTRTPEGIHHRLNAFNTHLRESSHPHPAKTTQPSSPSRRLPDAFHPTPERKPRRQLITIPGFWPAPKNSKHHLEHALGNPQPLSLGYGPHLASRTEFLQRPHIPPTANPSRSGGSPKLSSRRNLAMMRPANSIVICFAAPDPETIPQPRL